MKRLLLIILILDKRNIKSRNRRNYDREKIVLLSAIIYSTPSYSNLSPKVILRCAILVVCLNYMVR